MSELGNQTLSSIIAEVKITRQPLFELDAATLLLSAGKCALQHGSVADHVPAWVAICLKLTCRLDVRAG